jgi:hypothetical protein
MIGNREEEEARPSDLGHTRYGSDLDGTGLVTCSGWLGRIPPSRVSLHASVSDPCLPAN